MPDEQRMPGRINQEILYGLFFVAAFLLLAVGALLLWNAFMPRLINVPAINYWQALGLVALCRILFGRFRFEGFSRQNDKGPRFMSEEDRAAFKEEWRKRCRQRGED